MRAKKFTGTVESVRTQTLNSSTPSLIQLPTKLPPLAEAGPRNSTGPWAPAVLATKLNDVDT